MSSRPVIAENQWICGGSRCQQVNSADNLSCEFCGRSKPRGKGQVGHEIGKEAAEKSKGLFAAEDWSCSKCGNINWARRLQCNICNAAKCGEVEARTGYGGGYMDRQQVERRRNTSDDEYDHFGRRKKKANSASVTRKNVRDNSPSSDRSNGKAEPEEDGDDDEDDDESDSDLAKYDLVDLAEESANETQESNATKDFSSGGVVADTSGREDARSPSDGTSSSEISSTSTNRSNSASSHSYSTKRARHHKHSSSESSRSSRDRSFTGSSRRSSRSTKSHRSHRRSSTSRSRSRSSESRGSSPLPKRRHR